MGWDWQTIKQLLTIRKEDYLNASLLFLYLFLVITALMIGKSVSTALFINRFGALQLPYGIIAQTILITVLIAGYLRLWRVYQPPTLISSSLVLFAVSSVVLWWLLPQRSSVVITLLYMWGGIYGGVAPVQVWTIGNFIFTTRDARRYFGFIGSGGILGFIFGGYLSKTLAPLFGAENLLPTVAVFCVVSALFVQWIWRRNSGRISELQMDSERNFSLKQSAMSIWNSRYLLLITSLVTIMSLATKIVDVQFSAITEQFFRDENEMTAFFGSVYTYLGWGAFLLQLLFGGKLLDKLGIGVTILILPLSLLTSTLAALFFTALWTAVLLRLSDQVFKHSIDKSTTELLYLPIPTDVKIEVKSFIDTVVLRGGDGAAALLLLLFTSVIPLINRARPGTISWLNLPIIAALIYVAFQIRKEYLNALRSGFKSRGLDPKKISQYIAEPATLQELNQYLRSPEPAEILYTLDILMQSERREELLLPHLKRLLRHPTAAVRLKALQMLSTFSHDYVLPEVEALLNDEDADIRTAAARYVYTHSHTDILTRVQSLPDYPAHVIQGGILLNLLQQHRADNWSVARIILDGMVKNREEEAKAARVEAARVLGLIELPVKWHCYLVDLMQDDAPEVVAQALDSAGRTQHHDFIPFLLEALAERRTQVAAREALVHFGHRILGTLQDHLRDPSVNAQLRSHIPRVLSRIGGQEAVNILLDCLEQRDVQLRYKILKALNRLRAADATLQFDEEKILPPLLAELKQYYRYTQLLVSFNPAAPPTLDAKSRRLDLLTTSLLERQEHAMERIFRFLGLLYAHRDIHQSFYGLRSPRPQNRANTIEFLDNLLDPSLRKYILPLIDQKVTLGQRAHKGRVFWKWKPLAREEALTELLQSPNRWLCACAMYAAGQQGVNGLTGALQQWAESPDALLRETARFVLKD